MKEEIYKKIIKNSKIPYLKINCKKDDNNKFVAIEVIDQSKEAERFFHLLTENNILNKEITDMKYDEIHKKLDFFVDELNQKKNIAKLLIDKPI